MFLLQLFDDNYLGRSEVYSGRVLEAGLAQSVWVGPA